MTTSNNVLNDKTNRRFIRHQHLFFCEPEDMMSVFVSKLEELAPPLKYEVPGNFIWITFNTFKLFKGKLESLLLITDITENERNFIYFSESNSLIAIISHFLSKFTMSLSSMGDYTNNEAIRVWDRIFADYCNKYQHSDKLLHDCLATCCLEYELIFPGFTSAVEKEKQQLISIMMTKIIIINIKN
jgi:hypothetical protein